MQTKKYVEIYGKARFCYLNEPDTEFDPKGVYSVSLETTKAEGDPIVKAIEEALSKEIADFHKNNKNKSTVERGPKGYTVEGDKFIFKAKSKFKPEIWDKDQKKLTDKNIWKDSTMWVQCKLNPYNKGGKVGCSLYMSSVQIDELVEGSSQNGTCPFKKREHESRLPK